MELPIVHKIPQSKSVQGLPCVSPLPLLTYYYFLRDAELFVLNIQTQEQYLIDVQVKGFLLCDACGSRGACIVYLTREDVLMLAFLEGTRLVSSHALRIRNFQGAGLQLVCSIPGGFIFVCKEHLVAILLNDLCNCNSLQSLWQTRIESTPLRFQCDSKHVFVLTSAQKIVSYNLSTGCSSFTWDLGETDPFEVTCFAPLLSKHHQYIVLLCRNKLMSLCAPSYRTKQRVTPFSKPQHREHWQHLMEVPPGLHCLVHRGNHLLFFWGPEVGLTQLAVIEMGHGSVVCRQKLHMNAPFTVLYDYRHCPCWDLPVLIQFEDRLVTPCLGVTQQMLLHEVMDRHGARVAGFMSQRNSWGGNIAVDVLQQGIRHRQLDTIAFFLQSKEEVLETVVARHMEKWNQVLEDLLETVQENRSQLTSRHFAQQLLQQLLCFVVRLLCMVESADDEDQRYALCSKLQALRQHLPKQSAHLTCPGVLVKYKELDSHMRSAHNVVHFAFVEGHVPTAQYNMCNTKKVSLAELRSMCLHFVFNKLSTGEDVSSTISSMGLPPRDEMNRLLLWCRSAHLRSLLSKALGDDEVPKPVYQRLAKLEEAHLCHEIQIQDGTNSEAVIEAARAGYSRLAPGWLLDWTTEVDDRILADALQGRPYEISRLVNKTYWLLMLESGHLEAVLVSRPQNVGGESLVNLGSQCFSMWHVHNTLLCALVRDGIFSEETLEDFGDVLSLLGEANHPLDVLFSSAVSVSLEDLVHRLLHHCLQHDLAVFLYFLTCEVQCNVRPQCHLCNIPVVTALLSHLSWIKEPDDKGIALGACWALVRTLHGRPKDSSDLDLAALLNDHKVLQSVHVGTAQNVSLYSLLGRPWNTARLFIWQNMRSSDKDAVIHPHFSHPALMESCGLKEKLSPTYYFFRGRPCFAYLKHLTQHLVGQHTISSKRLKAALKAALRMTHLHFEDPLVVASCVTFLELSGTDSVALRVDVQCARMLRESGNTSQQKSIVELFEDMQQNKAKADQMLRSLSDAVQRNLQRSTQQGVELFLGLLLRAFAVHHGLEPPLTMLQWSAQNNDWLGFLLWTQLLQFPKIQVLDAVMQFEESCLREHLSKALLEVSSLRNTDDSGNVPSRNLRASLYSRIGLQSVERLSPVSAESLSEADAASVYSNDSTEAAVLEEPVAVYSKELVSLLLEGRSDWSWEHLLRAAVQIWSPIPCVIAACCSDAPLVSCFALWLVTSGRRRSMELLSFKEHTLRDLLRTMEDALLEGRLNNLLLGLHVFQPESPLVPLVEFLAAFHLERKGKHAVGKLQQFRDAVVTCFRRSGAAGLSSAQWVASTAINLLGTMLCLCSSWQEQRSLLRCCLQASLQKISGAPDFAMLVNLLEHSEGEDLGITLYDLFVAEKPMELLERAVHFLNQTRHFVRATAVARCAALHLADVVLEQMKLKFDDCAHKSEEDMEQVQWDDFLKECDRCFQEAGLDAQQAFDFFKVRASLVKSYCVKYKIMRLASVWLDKTCYPPEECDSYRLHVWLFRIKAEKEKPSEIIPSDEPDHRALILPSMATRSPVISLADAEELEALERVTNQLLLHEQFGQATFVISAFGHATLDYRVLTTCIRLAQGDMQPRDIDPELLQHAKQVKACAPFRRQSTVTIVNPAELKKPHVKNTTSDILECIIEMCDASGHALSLCNRVLVALKAAIALSRPYQEVAGEMHTISLLDRLLQCADRMALAKDVIMVYNIPERDVTRLLFDKTVAAIGSRGNPGCGQKDILEDFENVLQLCQDPAELGNLLLRARKADLRALDGDSKGLSIEVELCIRAHDCFSVSCFMEGISRTLHRCRKLAMCLVANHEFPLLVRLLTGIRRYSEMSYVFDILHDHDHFELLFQRGMEKVPYLRVALLDYLKHRSSAGSDTYTMLTLNFNMHREIAEILESAATKKIKAIANNDGLAWSKEELLTLENTLQDLADAAESYIKAECILGAQACAKKAQLVALQLRYFARKVAVVNLDQSRALAFLVTHPKFFEAQLVSDAYCLQQTWWSGAVFNRVIQDGDWEYLKDMRAAGCELTPLHLEDITRRYQMQQTGPVQREAMKRLLEAVSCVKTRFDLAQRLGFLETAQHTLSTQPYLRDSRSSFTGSHPNVS
ncbi:spatacsin-like isoform X2 [Ornithodoros turicata]|uniref:spatacsin-like isoform X2 n=1 Tax=Ornithodoros turicata TaxID=34597 RepID=UPI003139301F